MFTFYIILFFIGQHVPSQSEENDDYNDVDNHVNEFLANPSSDKIMEHPMQVIIKDGMYRTFIMPVVFFWSWSLAF